MRSSRTVCPDGLRPHVVLAGLAWLVLSCAPSDFDDLSSEKDSAECAEVECLDGGADGLDTWPQDDLDADLAPDAPDPAAEDADVEELDAAVEEPADDAAMEVEDAAPEASTPAPDGGPPPVCGGKPPACKANASESQMEACGNCGSGVRTRSRTCAVDGCSWGAFGAWSACMDQDTECDPNGPPQTQTVACPTCGTKTQSRSCSPDTCTWGAWSDASACTWCEACVEVVYCDTPPDVANRGTWCRQKACSREQALESCRQRALSSLCGGKITEPLFMEYL